MNICRWLQANEARAPEKTALIFEDRRYTHREFFHLVKQFGNALKGLGVGPGDRVGVFLPNCPEFLIARWGAIAIGAAASPMNIMFQKDEARYVLNNAAPRVLVTTVEKLELIDEIWPSCPSLEHVVLVDEPDLFGTHDFWKLLETGSPELALHDCHEDDMCDLFYTSGTTGRPKGVMCSHANFENLLRYEKLVWSVGEEERALVVLPLFHAKGLIIPCLLATYTGGCQTLMRRWDTKSVLQTIQNQKITLFAGVPTMYTYMLADPDIDKYDLSSLTLCRVGGAPIPIEVHHEFEKRTRVKLIEGYGCTGWVGTSHPLTGERMVGSIGKALGVYHPEIYCDTRIVDDNDQDVKQGAEGELIIRGGQIPKGFWRLPGRTRKDYRGGWFHTGDIAREDEQGFIYLVGRKDDLIITSGFNVYPREVEELLYNNTKVLEAAVIGVGDRAKGQTIKAFVVLKDGCTATETEIIDYCRERISHYKAPRMVEFAASLPKTSSGKIQHRMLREPGSKD